MHSNDQPFADDSKVSFLSTVPAGRNAWRLAIAVVLVSTFVCAVTVPFVSVHLEKIPAFVPAYQSALAINDLITAILLFGLFKRVHSWALLFLASGYLFNSLIIVAHTLSFPGVFSPTGLLGAGDQTTAWLYVLWHAGFPLFVLAYAAMRLRENSGEVPLGKTTSVVLGSTILVICLVGGLTVLATAGMHFLPVIIQGSDYSLLVSKGVSPAILLLSFAAIVLLLWKKPTTVLDLWLMVVMCVWVYDVALSAVFSSARFDLGWYAGRTYGLLAASFILTVLLIETNGLQKRLALTTTQLAQALRKNRSRFMQILDNAPMIMAVMDLQGRYMTVNHGLEKWTKQDGAKLLGKTIRDLFGDTEYTSAHEAMNREVLATQKPLQRELTTPHPNGLQTSLFAKFPLFDAGGKVEAIGSIAFDITDKKKADAALQRFFETSIDLILVADSKGDILKVSPSSSAILGYEPEEMVGHNAGKFVHPDDLESTRNEMRMARRGRHTRNFETRYIHKKGRVVTLSWTGVWSELAQQHFFIGRDMSDRLKMEKELRQAQKMEAIGQLTGGIAHDYNNLLTVILGNAELLAEALRDKPELHSLAQLTLDAADRSAILTQRLLAFGRRQALESQATDINELLADMVGLMKVMLGEQVKIELLPGPDLWTTKIDRGQFETAVVNLGVNARDAMPNGGTLTIETGNAILDQDYAVLNPSAQPGEYVGVTVSDTGAGMTPEVLSRVFEPFFTTKEVGKGTGLGLSMIYGFVKQSGGHVTIYSEPGMGTVVRLYFPRSDAPSLVPTLLERDDSILPTGNETILLVEDDPLVRAHTEKQLVALGYRVHVAEKAVQALDLIGGGLKPDLLFTDIVMPGGKNGPQLATEVRKQLPHIKVLFTSGYTQGAIVQGEDKAPGTNFLAKPFRRAELAAKIRNILEEKILTSA